MPHADTVISCLKSCVHLKCKSAAQHAAKVSVYIRLGNECVFQRDVSGYSSLQCDILQNLGIMEYVSTPYIGMAPR